MDLTAYDQLRTTQNSSRSAALWMHYEHLLDETKAQDANAHCCEIDEIHRDGCGYVHQWHDDQFYGGVCL